MPAVNAGSAAPQWLGTLRAELRSVRFRVLAAALALMAAGLVASGASTHAVQLARLNERVNEELLGQSARLRAVAEQGARDGRPYTSLEELFTAFLQGATPGSHESVMAMLGDGTTLLPAGNQATVLNTTDVLERIQSEHLGSRTVFRDMSIDGRTVRLAISPVALGTVALGTGNAGNPGAGSPEQGILLASNEIGRQREEVLASLWTFGAASLAILLLAGGAGFVVVGRLLDPVHRLRRATEDITFEDLSTRVKVPAGDDDVSQLAVNFNHMLDRLESGFAEQRRFLDDAGHELRTPLTIISGHLELLQAGDPRDVEQTRALLLEELERMQALVDDLLVLARSGRPDFIHGTWFDTRAFLEAAMERIKVLADRRWRIDGNPSGRILADRNRLLQAVEQLAANAVRSTLPQDTIALGAAWVGTPEPGQPPSDTASLAEASPPGLEIWVADSGCGILPEDQERIFERFFRARRPHGREGSGLGLPIVKAIAEAHGGSLRVESDLGRGARFVLWIPEGSPPAGHALVEPPGSRQAAIVQGAP
ncbi:two-component sensor histidine kinase [Arthrobacter sp. SW1]|uniref:sensor histidine kinase n=1 Tax=Arthrobacter sp. SW1 TaxID=1920889 RepID=UPI000877C572|nr:HAMP domain-containing sensor histidine kinase [Arthrobacter sp. SW1]OFI37353.1 two-component sensor histidine kinase [Arthrobacter sp. SW1]